MESDYSFGLDVFSGKFYKETVNQEKNKGKNVILSALSADIVFSMVSLGAQDETRREICKCLCIDGDIEKVTPSIKTLISELNHVNGVTLKLANKLYIRPTNSNLLDSVRPAYKSSIEDIFVSEVQQVDFSQNVQTANAINGWVQNKTDNCIRDLIKPDSLSGATVAILINAIYFKGTWAKQFDPVITKKEDFNLADGSKVKVDMMGQKDKFYYKEVPEIDAKVIILPYENKDVSMILFLPNDTQGIEKLEISLAEGTKKYLENFNWEEVIVKLPKFKIETTIDVKKVFLNLGATRVFSTNAQLRGILNDDIDLLISEAIQKAFIEVNEEGSKAAAATGVQVMLMCAPRPKPICRFIADRPFYYQINFKGHTLFSGSFKNP